jgi:hypothetical protein
MISALPALTVPEAGKGRQAAARSRCLFPDILVHQVRTSNGDVCSLRMLPEDAMRLWLDVGVALGELPALPPSDDEDQGE